jgi:type I restriction enzyme S subunit
MTIVATSVTRLIADMAAGERESRTLATLRDALLPKLISGELRMKDAERMFAEAEPTAQARTQHSRTARMR